MIKVIQFGEGNFLRSFVDLYFQKLNDEGGDYSVTIVKPRPHGSLEAFRRQNNRYHVVLRGMKEGKAMEQVCLVTVVDRVFSPFEEPEAFWALARDPDVKMVISNTTEAGICFCGSDKMEELAGMTFPGKLTRLLYARYEAGLPGLYLLPTELIDDNASQLHRCVDAYIRLWDLPEGFRQWNDTQNYYCNTLVDRIVSGHPRDPETKQHMEHLAGEDALLSVAEPFGLWAVEKKGDIASLLPQGRHNLQLVLTEDIPYYKKRKVRVLNGSHTNLVPAGLLMGKETVYDCMTDERLYRFFRESLEEIIPFVSPDEVMTRQFAVDTEERFRNSYLNHQLSSIALNCISKWRARNLPTFRDYYRAKGALPPMLTLGFACLMYLYQTRYSELRDEGAYLAWFRNGGSVSGFMADTAVWGEDLTAYPGFAEAVAEHIRRLERGECVL